MKQILVFGLIISLFSCKRENHVTKELRKALKTYINTEAGDTVKINKIDVISIDSVSEYRDLLGSIAKRTAQEKEYITIVKSGKGNMNLMEMMLLNKKELDKLNAKLAVQFDTFRTSYYNVKAYVSMTYRNKMEADTSNFEFNKDFTVKKDY